MKLAEISSPVSRVNYDWILLGPGPSWLLLAAHIFTLNYP